jgi:TonB family protein
MYWSPGGESPSETPSARSIWFDALKQALSGHWDPRSKLRQRDPTCELYSGRDRCTVLTVVMDDGGRVKDIWVEKSSGLDFLDLEAILAFERAQPLPAPPRELLNSDGGVTFTFSFDLDMKRLRPSSVSRVDGGAPRCESPGLPLPSRP